MKIATRKADLPPAYASAHLRTQSFDATTNSIAVVWTTGASVLRRSPEGGYYEEELIVAAPNVRLERLNAGAPFLDAHRNDRLEYVIGSVIPGSARVTAGHGRARIKLSNAIGAEDIVQNIRDGIIRNVSVGYVVHRVEIVERDSDMPIWRVVDWEPIEISGVAVPADAGAQIRTGARGAVIERAEATLVTLDYWSPAACRARMIATQRRHGILRAEVWH